MDGRVGGAERSETDAATGRRGVVGAFSIAEKLDRLFRQAGATPPRRSEAPQPQAQAPQPRAQHRQGDRGPEAGSPEVRQPGGQAEPSYMAVAEAIRATQGVQISHTYIWQLRTGRRDNPTVAHLTALATYFGVPVAYFLDDEQTAKIDAQLELLRTLRDAGVTQMALRAADVSPRGRETINELIRKVWESERRLEE
jgi:transcriptional regulator with XRE-family HTH domain